jgi:hypothetical protein
VSSKDSSLSRESASQTFPDDLNERLQEIAPLGTPIEKWIFPALELTGGLIIRVNDMSDIRWTNLFGAGMPPDLTRMDVFFSVAPFNSLYKDFAIHGRGVVADPANPEKGKGAWLWTITMAGTGETLNVNIWFVEIYLRNSSTQLLAHYNAGTNPTYTTLTLGRTGVMVELIDIDPTGDKQSALRLIQHSDVLLTKLQSILHSAATAERGRKPKAVATPETIPLWTKQYDDALTALQSELQNRERKQLKKYTPQERLWVIKRAFPEIDNKIAESLAEFTSLSDVALRYTGWVCSKIEIGTWQSTNYEKIRRESDKINNVTRTGNGQSNVKLKSGTKNSK